MNKEALRKELEDAWKDGFNSSCDVMSSYIATRLAAIDDGDDGVSGKDFAKWIEENCEVIREPGITLYRYNDYRHGEGVGNYILDDIYTTYKEIVGVDDGQEGKGLMTIEDKVRYNKEANTAPALPVADGEGEKVELMIEYLDGLPISSGEGFNMLKAIKQKLHETTLPSAVTGGVKDALRFAEWVSDKNWFHDGDYRWFQEINQINRKSTLQLYEKYLSESQPAKEEPTLTPLQIWNKAIMVADNVCHNRVNIFAGQTQIVDAIEICRKEIMQYFNDEYHIKKMLGTEPPEDKGPI